MVRIAGVDLQETKISWIGLTKIFGIGRSQSKLILEQARVDPQKRVKDLTDEEISRIQKTIDGGKKVEGDLKQEIRDNLGRFKRIACYRGKRHLMNLPVRGQRTRTNARTKRGKRVTIGALKKEAFAKLDQSKKAAETKN